MSPIIVTTLLVIGCVIVSVLIGAVSGLLLRSEFYGGYISLMLLVISAHILLNVNAVTLMVIMILYYVFAIHYKLSTGGSIPRQRTFFKDKKDNDKPNVMEL